MKSKFYLLGYFCSYLFVYCDDKLTVKEEGGPNGGIFVCLWVNDEKDAGGLGDHDDIIQRFHFPFA